MEYSNFTENLILSDSGTNLEYADFRFMGISVQFGKLPNGILSDGKRT